MADSAQARQSSAGELATERAIASSRRERSDISERFIWLATALMFSVLVGCALLVHLVYRKQPPDRTLQLPLPVFPAPRLQSSPSADMREYAMREQRRLQSSGWIDDAHTAAHIPIDEAMHQVAEEGIEGWPEAAPP